jgi:DNA ligase-1
MKLPTLYSRTSTGAIEEWSIEFSGNSFWTVHGQIDGAKQTSEPTICKGKNIGRANETNPEQQAEAEAKAKWKKKKDKGYHESISDVDKVTFIEPMLAHSYNDRKEEIDMILEGGGVVYSQPKLDGCRCLVTKDGMFTRNGKTWVSTPHILKALLPVFSEYPDAIFDGELYCDKFKHDFNQIVSLIKKSKPTPEDLKASADLIEYWVYDTLYLKDHPFINRFGWICRAMEDARSDKIKVVHTVEIRSNTELNRQYEQYLASGMEGQMIRVNAPYEQKRSKRLLKRKEFQDEEFAIIDIEEGEGNKTGIAGNMLLRDKKLNKVFSSNIKGSREYCKKLLDNRDKLVGKEATVQFQNRTPDGIPRFPYVVKVDRKDYE